MGFIDRIRGLFSGKKEEKFVSSHQHHLKNLASTGKHIFEIPTRGTGTTVVEWSDEDLYSYNAKMERFEHKLNNVKFTERSNVKEEIVSFYRKLVPVLLDMYSWSIREARYIEEIEDSRSAVIYFMFRNGFLHFKIRFGSFSITSRLSLDDTRFVRNTTLLDNYVLPWEDYHRISGILSSSDLSWLEDFGVEFSGHPRLGAMMDIYVLQYKLFSHNPYVGKYYVYVEGMGVLSNKVTHSFSQCKRSDVVAILNNADPFNNQKSAENYAKVLLQNLKPFGIRSKDIDVYSLGRLHSQYRSQVSQF